MENEEFVDFKGKLNAIRERFVERKHEEIERVDVANEELMEQLQKIITTYEEALHKKDKEIEAVKAEYTTLKEQAEEERADWDEALKNKNNEVNALKYDFEKFKAEAEEKEEENNQKLQDKVEQLDEASSEIENQSDQLQQAKLLASDNDEKIEKLTELVKHLKARHVPLLKNSKKDHGITFVEKNNGDKESPYLIISGQLDNIKSKIKALKESRRYPRGKVHQVTKVTNDVAYYTWLRENDYIVCDPHDEKHFRLGKEGIEMLIEDLLHIPTPCLDVAECVDLFSNYNEIENDDESLEENDSIIS